eukprot:scaffold16440_cov146-Skeletonema_dohrnii-CCMP3373.AAC.5
MKKDFPSSPDCLGCSILFFSFPYLAERLPYGLKRDLEGKEITLTLRSWLNPSKSKQELEIPLTIYYEVNDEQTGA